MLPSVSGTEVDLRATRTSSWSMPRDVGAPTSVPMDRRAKSWCAMTVVTSWTETCSAAPPEARVARANARERARAAAGRD